MAGLTLGSSVAAPAARRSGADAAGARVPDALSTAFTSAADDERRLYVGGAAGLLDDVREDEFASYRRLLEILEHRAALLELLRGSLDPRRPFVRVGAELEHPELSNVALVGAAYGLAHRTLGTVSLHRAGADGLRQGDPLGPVGGGRALPLRRRRLRRGVNGTGGASASAVRRC